MSILLFMFRIILKILFLPIILLLALFVWICSGLLYCTAFILGFISSVITLFAIIIMFIYPVHNGIILLVFAFLISPVGLPMIAAWLLGKIQGLRYFIQDKIYDF